MGIIACLDLLSSCPSNTAHDESRIAHEWGVPLLAFFHFETALPLRDHPTLERFSQSLVVLADNVGARNLSVRSVRNRNS